MLKKVLKSVLGRRGYQIVRSDPDFPIVKPIDPKGVEILSDPAFQESCREVSELTLLDTDRLANLWQLCRVSNPLGNILEIGSYKGGSALHLSNSCPERRIIICDSFSGFETLNLVLDRNFEETMFKDNNKEKVEALFRSRHRDFQIIQGFFPESCKGINIGPISFVHLDVDVYKATIESLYYVSEITLEKSIIVLDDYFRKADGVNKAVSEFVARKRDWVCFPIFPGQGILVHLSWFGC